MEHRHHIFMSNGNCGKYMEVGSPRKINVQKVFTSAVIELLAPEYNPIEPDGGSVLNIMIFNF